MQQAQAEWISEEEYWALNDASYHVKYEWFNGQIFAMAGGTERHGVLATNAGSLLRNQRKGGYRVVVENLRVQISQTGLYTYPDVVVYCPPFRFHEQRSDTLLNPSIIVEVLSKSTQDYDRGDKFAHYRGLESLQHYVLVLQERVEVEVFTRQDNDDWLMHTARGFEACVTLSSMDATLSLAELYEDTDVTQTELPLRAPYLERDEGET